jgi:hypothetical protein
LKLNLFTSSVTVNSLKFNPWQDQWKLFIHASSRIFMELLEFPLSTVYSDGISHFCHVLYIYILVTSVLELHFVTAVPSF